MTGRRSVDEAQTLEELSPVEMFGFAVYFPYHDRERSYTRPFRRYRTLAHAKTAQYGGGNIVSEGAKIYKFNWDTQEWEEHNGE